MDIKSYAAYTNQGPYLQVNEDNCFANLDNQIFGVLDGFGGSGIGDIGTNKIAENIQQFYTKFGGDPDSTLPFFFSPRYLLEGNALINAIHYSHQESLSDNNKKDLSERYGASCAVGVIADSIFAFTVIGNTRVIHIRNSRIYRSYQGKTLRDVNRDSFDGHFQTSPLEGIGLFPDIQFDLSECRLREGDVFLLMTDGIYSRIEDSEIESFVNQHTIPLECVESLVNLANERGNRDNQSVVLMKF